MANNSAYCPDCGTRISIATPKEGAYVKCPECMENLVIVSVTPLTLSWTDFDSSDIDDLLGDIRDYDRRNNYDDGYWEEKW